MIRNIDRTGYLEYAARLTAEETALIEEFGAWLPENIIDCHAHCNLEAHVRSIDDRAYKHMLSTFPFFSLEESAGWNHLLYPRQKVRSLRFPKTFRGINHRRANAYLLENSPADDRIALYGLPDDIDYTVSQMKQPRVSALKMYYSYLEPPATDIYQYFPPPILEEAQFLGCPIVLHPPRTITLCLDQITRLLNDFPRLKICLAHLALTKSLVPGLAEAFLALKRYGCLNFDTALSPSDEVLTAALSILGPDRIMYGSDSPLDLIRSRPYRHPQLGERLATEFPYHWTDPEEHAAYKALAAGVIHAHWPPLIAIKKVLDAYPDGERDNFKEKIFFSNAALFYGF